MAEHEHSPEAIRERLSAGPRQSYLRDRVQGAATTFAVVAAGVVGVLVKGLL